MNHFSSAEPEPIRPVRVRRHPVDWEGADFDEVTLQRASAFGPRLNRGAWYLNTRYTVTCPGPTTEFFRTVMELRSAWLRTCRQVQGSSGQRQQARKAERQGRRAAFVELDPLTASGAQPQPPPEVIPLSALTDAERQEVVQRGRFAKQATFSGILFLDGELIPPRTWQAQANKLLSPDPTPKVGLPEQGPFNGPTVPIKSLGLIVPNDAQIDASTSSERTVPHV